MGRLADDHVKARTLERELLGLSYIAAALPAETNIGIFRLAANVGTEKFLAHLKNRDVLALSNGPQTVRMVFHLDVHDSQLDPLFTALRGFAEAAPSVADR